MATTATRPVPTATRAGVRKRWPEAAPECGNELEFEGGCAVCRYCGYSRC